MQFLILSLLFVVLERLRPWRREQHLHRGGILTDLLHWLFNGYLFYLGYSIITGYAFSLFTDAVRSTGFGAILDVRLLTGLPLVVQFVILFLVQDFLMWGTHNLLHRVPFLWEIHKVHHSIETMDWIGNMRYHYGEIIVYNLTMFLPLLVLGADSSLFIHLNIFNTVIGHFNHANIRVDLGPLRYLLNSPRMHIWHHDRSGLGSRNKNFAIGLSVWDWIFGTAYYPKPGEADQPESLGFDGLEEFPKTFLGQQLLPISRAWQRKTKLYVLLALLGTATAVAGGTGGKGIRIDTAARSISFDTKGNTGYRDTDTDGMRRNRPER